MAFNVGDPVLAEVETGTTTLTQQPGTITAVLANSMYQVEVIGLILTLPESVLTAGS